VKVHLSALKHGVSAEDAVQAAEWSLWIEPLDENGPPEAPRCPGDRLAAVSRSHPQQGRAP